MIFIAFFTLFSFDAGSFLGFLIHMIPSFVVLAALLIAWKWKHIGAILFFLLGILSTLFFSTFESIAAFMGLSFPLFGAALLFFLDFWTEE
jgi:hypothetical protein